MSHRRSSDDGKKHLTLWLAVGGSMTVIVGLWMVLLPSQLGDFTLFSPNEDPRWEKIRLQSLDSRRKFEDSLARLKRQLDGADPESQAAAASIEKLKEKLEQKQ